MNSEATAGIEAAIRGFAGPAVRSQEALCVHFRPFCLGMFRPIPRAFARVAVTAVVRRALALPSHHTTELG
jgi:hypothetical protein